MLVPAYVGVGDDGVECLLQHSGALAHSFFSRSLRVTACDLGLARRAPHGVYGINSREHCLSLKIIGAAPRREIRI